jgi:hypothetical protein
MKHIATIEKNSAEEIHVDLHEWKSEVYVDIRVWYRAEPAADGDLHPTMKGLRFNAELLQDLRSAIDEAIRVIDSGEEIRTTQETAKTAREMEQEGKVVEES